MLLIALAISVVVSGAGAVVAGRAGRRLYRRRPQILALIAASEELAVRARAIEQTNERIHASAEQIRIATSVFD